MARPSADPDQFDLFEPPHERCEDGRGLYLQFLIAPPTELSPANDRELALAGVSTGRRHGARV